MMVESISHFFKLLNNQIIEAIPMIGVTKPPGALNVFSDGCCGLLLNLTVAKITVRYIINITALAIIANCLNPPDIEKIKISEA